MSLIVSSDSSYRDITILDQRVPAVNSPGQIEDFTLREDTMSEKLKNSQDNNTENDKKTYADPEKKMRSEISKANNQFKYTKCEFKFFDDINRYAVKVVDKETNEVIREIPPEKTMEFIEKLWELAGLLYDEKA